MSAVKQGSFFRKYRLLLLAVMLFALFSAPAAAAAQESPPPPRDAQETDPDFEAAVTVRKSMVISIAEQKLYCLENGRVVYIFLVSTGAGGTPTPLGQFRILYKDQAHPVPKYPGCVCYYWMGFYEDYAIHAWPTYNGVQSNYEGLGYPASHGCVRLDPTQAHVPFYWAPIGTPLSIIPGPFQAPPPPIQGGTVSRGTPETSTTWFFAEGFTGGEFDEYILIQNPNLQDNVVTISCLKPDGSVTRHDVLIYGQSRLTVNVGALPGMEGTDVSVRLDSGYPVVAERAMYFSYLGKTGGHVSLGVTAPSREWYFAEGYTGGGFDEYVLLLNPEPADAAVSLDCLKPDGGVYTHDVLVRANSRLTVPIDSLPGMEGTDVSVRITSDRPVVAERAMYFGYQECPGGHVQTGYTEPGTLFYMAEGCTSPYFDTYILVMNPGDASLFAGIKFIGTRETISEWGIDVAPHSRATLKVNDLPRLSSTEFAVRVDTNAPAVVERAMYFSIPR